MGEDDLGASLSQSFGYRPPDPARSPYDERKSTVQVDG